MEEGFERVAFFFRKRNSVQQCPFMEGARVEGEAPDRRRNTNLDQSYLCWNEDSRSSEKNEKKFMTPSASL